MSQGCAKAPAQVLLCDAPRRGRQTTRTPVAIVGLSAGIGTTTCGGSDEKKQREAQAPAEEVQEGTAPVALKVCTSARLMFATR